jgi:hypothetical protein
MDEILETILKLYGKPGIDTSYLPKLVRNKANGEVRRGYGEPDSSLEEVCWQGRSEWQLLRTFAKPLDPHRSGTTWDFSSPHSDTDSNLIRVTNPFSTGTM